METNELTPGFSLAAWQMSLDHALHLLKGVQVHFDVSCTLTGDEMGWQVESKDPVTQSKYRAIRSFIAGYKWRAAEYGYKP